MKILLSIVGIVLILFGGLFILQSLNIVRWPADSFMLGEPSWSWKGSLIALAGIGLLWWARRK